LSAGIVNFLRTFRVAVSGPVQAPIIGWASRCLHWVLGCRENGHGHLSWGDAWTNMIQPFWALPALAILLGWVRKCNVGYCLMGF